MSQSTETLRRAKLNNNCPVCFGNSGLEFTFQQARRENLFLKKASPTIEFELYCHNCRQIIYPVNWDEDIERVFDYNKKIAETHQQTTRVKPLFYIMILLATALAGALVYFWI